MTISRKKQRRDIIVNLNEKNENYITTKGGRNLNKAKKRMPGQNSAQGSTTFLKSEKSILPGIL
ncbi:hypothetical protein ES703_89073 [subsurface metagenome]